LALTCALGLQLLMRWAMAWQLGYVLRVYGEDLSLRTVLVINLVMVFYGLVLPGELATGGIGWYRLRKAGCDSSTAIAAIVVTRLANLMVLFITGAVFWIASGQMENYQAGAFLILMLVGMGASYAFLVRGSDRLASLPLPQKIRHSWRRFIEMLAELRTFSASQLSVLFASTLGLNLLGVASHFLFAQAVGLSLSIWTIGWIRSAVLAFGLLPFSLGGFGLREGSLIYLLHLNGATAEQAVTYSLLTVFATVSVGLLGAACELVDMRQQHTRRQ